MNLLGLVSFLLVKLFQTMIRQNFPPSKFCTIWYAVIPIYFVDKWCCTLVASRNALIIKLHM